MTTERETHTPGLWEWDEVPLPGVTPSVVDPHPTAWVLGSRNPDGTRGLGVLRHRAPWLVTEANRYLIAAAPDLLEVALSIVDHVCCETHMSEVERQALAAVEQAEGRGS